MFYNKKYPENKDKVLLSDIDREDRIEEGFNNVEIKFDEIDNRFDSISDYVVESDSNSRGSWEKWASGKLIQRGRSQHIKTTNETVGNSSIYNDNEVVTFPISFIGNPESVTLGAVRSSGVVWAGVRGITANDIDLLLIGATNTASGFVHYEAVGRWK